MQLSTELGRRALSAPLIAGRKTDVQLLGKAAQREEVIAKGTGKSKGQIAALSNKTGRQQNQAQTIGI